MANIFSNSDYRTTLTRKDSQFNAVPHNQYHLALNFSDSALKVCCIDANREKCLYLATHDFSEGFSSKRISVLEKLYQNDPILQARDWLSVTLSIDNQQYTLLPSVLLQEEQLDTYLAFSCPKDASLARHFTHNLLPVTVVFGVDRLLYEWFRKIYELAPLQCLHQASSLIEGSFHYVNHHRSTTSNRIFVFIASGYLHIVVLHRYELLYYNRFVYAHIDDCLQYILMVMQTLALNPRKDEIILAGDVQENAPIWEKVKAYVKKVNLHGKSTHIKWSSDLEKATTTSYFDILSSFLCHPIKTR